MEDTIENKENNTKKEALSYTPLLLRAL